MEYNENEVGKYKKKATKTVKKSKHKHIYKECLLHDKELNQYYVGEYCTVCNKRGNFKLFDTVPNENGRSRILRNEELVEKYKNYEIKEVNDIYRDKEVL